MNKFELDHSGLFSQEQISQLYRLQRGSKIISMDPRNHDAISQYKKALLFAGVLYTARIINAQLVFKKI